MIVPGNILLAAREAEVGNAHDTLVIAQEVCGLDVSMNDAALMGEDKLPYAASHGVNPRGKRPHSPPG
jgi:hypothetical protein